MRVDVVQLKLLNRWSMASALSQSHHDELLDPEVQLAASLDLPDSADELPVIPCQWSGCSSLFWELEPLLEHLNSAHIDGHAHPNGKFSCEWAGCARNGKASGTRSALSAHLRSHTGERPYICPRPECDKLFSRMDALQKHSQTMHAEKLPATRRPPTKKRKLEDGASVADEGRQDESQDGETPLAAESTTVDQAVLAEAEDDRDDEAMAALIAQHDDQSPAFVRFIVTAAKHKYAISEHAALVDELDLLQNSENQLRAEKDRLVEQVAAVELGPGASAFFSQPDPPYGGLTAWQPKGRRTMLPSQMDRPGETRKPLS